LTHPTDSKRRTGPFPLPNDPDKHELSEKLIKLGRILARPGRGRKWDGALCLPWSDRPRSSSLDWQWSARKCFCDASFFGGGNHGVCGCDDGVVVVVAAMQGRRRGIEDGNGCTGGMRGRGGAHGDDSVAKPCRNPVSLRFVRVEGGVQAAF
jgi:hypothetical protein